MGYLLGNYIHLTAKNYEQYGTNEWKDKNTQKATAQIFQAHENNILDLAQKFSIPNLKKIETDYNLLNQKQYQQFIKILQSKNIDDYFKQTLQEELIRRMSPKDNPWTEEQIQEIVKNLHWDDTRQTFYYSGSQFTGNKQNQKVHLSSLGEVDSFRYINTIMTRSQKMIAEIASHPILDQKHKNNYINDIKDQVIAPLKQVDFYQKRTKPHLKRLSKKAHKWLGTIDRDLANGYYNKLQSIRQTINGIDDLNTHLQWKLSELLGNMIANSSAVTGYQSVIDAITETLLKGDSFSKKNINEIALTGRLDQKTLKDNNISLQQNGSYIDRNGINQATYFFKGTGDGRQQKADIEFTIDSTSKQKIGISLKNTDISSYINKQSKNLTTDFVSLQKDSSLMLYLAGMQQQQKDIANHYLNIFAKHEDKDLDSDLRAAAIKSFQTALLFSALTGANQLREGGQASVLAIYDKTEINGIKQVKFFDIYDLVQNGLKGAQFSPKIENIFLKNDEEKNEDFSKRENASIRITKVLSEAKQKQVSVYLSKSYLMSVYK